MGMVKNMSNTAIWGISQSLKDILEELKRIADALEERCTNISCKYYEWKQHAAAGKSEEHEGDPQVSS